MEEIKVGEYIRTRFGEIGIFNGYNARKQSQWRCKIHYRNRKNDLYCTEEYIEKHSSNIIDLIEDKELVLIGYDFGECYEEFVTEVSRDIEDDDIPRVLIENVWLPINDYSIKLIGIVTKEQFKNAMYEVK